MLIISNVYSRNTRKLSFKLISKHCLILDKRLCKEILKEKEISKIYMVNNKLKDETTESFQRKKEIKKFWKLQKCLRENKIHIDSDLG